MNLFNRRELTLCHSLERCRQLGDRLAAAGIEYQVRVRSRSSRSRQDRLSRFGKMRDSDWPYAIYVKQEDLEWARTFLG